MEERKWVVAVAERGSRRQVNKTELKKVAKKVLNALDSSHLPPQVGELSILLCKDEEIHLLNKSHRGKDKPTDVLSFSMIEGSHYSGVFPSPLGDVVISLETAERQRERFGTSFPEEILRLLIHGIHHLFGFDHENVSPYTARKMRRSEEKLFASLKATAPTLLRK